MQKVLGGLSEGYQRHPVTLTLCKIGFAFCKQWSNDILETPFPPKPQLVHDEILIIETIVKASKER